MRYSSFIGAVHWARRQIKVTKMAKFHKSIKAAVKSLEKHAPTAMDKFVIVQVGQDEFDINHKNYPDKNRKIVVDGASLMNK